eukprot:gene4875-biopygen12577
MANRETQTGNSAGSALRYFNSPCEESTLVEQSILHDASYLRRCAHREQRHPLIVQRSVTTSRTERSHLRLSRVVRAARRALQAEHVEECLARGVAVVAEDGHELVRELLGHRRRRDLLAEVAPRLAHVADGDAAHWTLETAVGRERLEALAVQRVPARQHLRRLSTVEEELAADGAVAPQRVGDAGVLASQLGAVARVARVAVEEVVPSADAADAALVAVELTLGVVVVVEMADRTEVLAEAGAAAGALPRRRLLQLTGDAHDRVHRVPVQGVRVRIVMAEPARNNITAARCNEAAAAPVVLAAAAGKDRNCFALVVDGSALDCDLGRRAAHHTTHRVSVQRVRSTAESRALGRSRAKSS